MQRTIALSSSRCGVIAFVPSHYRVITPSPVVPLRHRHYTIAIAPLLQRSTLRWCDSELRYPDFIHLGFLYFLHVEILEIYTYHRLSYIIYIFCTVTSHAVNTSMYKLSTTYLHKLKLSSIHIEISLIDVNGGKKISAKLRLTIILDKVLIYKKFIIIQYGNTPSNLK